MDVGTADGKLELGLARTNLNGTGQIWKSQLVIKFKDEAIATRSGRRRKRTERRKKSKQVQDVDNDEVLSLALLLLEEKKVKMHQ